MFRDGQARRATSVDCDGQERGSHGPAHEVATSPPSTAWRSAPRSRCSCGTRPVISRKSRAFPRTSSRRSATSKAVPRRQAQGRDLRPGSAAKVADGRQIQHRALARADRDAGLLGGNSGRRGYRPDRTGARPGSGADRSRSLRGAVRARAPSPRHRLRRHSLRHCRRVRPERGAATLATLASGRTVAGRDTADLLGSDIADALFRCGALARVDGDVGLTARIFPMRSLYTFLPRSEPGEDLVYLGRDSLVLFKTIWEAPGYGHRGRPGDRQRLIAAALATRYDHVVAGDLSPTLCLHCRAHSRRQPSPPLALLGGADGRGPWAAVDFVRSRQCQCAMGARARRARRRRAARRFAAGGPTGFELPRRFIDAAVDLLAPSGRGFIACPTSRSATDGARCTTTFTRVQGGCSK